MRFIILEIFKFAKFIFIFALIFILNLIFLKILLHFEGLDFKLLSKDLEILLIINALISFICGGIFAYFLKIKKLIFFMLCINLSCAFSLLELKPEAYKSALQNVNLRETFPNHLDEIIFTKNDMQKMQIQVKMQESYENYLIFKDALNILKNHCHANLLDQKTAKIFIYTARCIKQTSKSCENCLGLDVF